MSPGEPGWFALIGAAFLAGGFVKGAIGFGLPLVTIAVLPFLVPLDLALALNSVVLLVTNAVQFVRAGALRAVAVLSVPLLAGTAVATPVGIWIATGLPATVLLGVLGACIVTFAVLGLLSITPRLPASPFTGFVVGCAGGIVGAFSSAPGPVFVMYLVALGLPRATFMGAMGLVMGLVGAFLTAGYLLTGALDATRLAGGAAVLVPATLGFFLGDRMARRLPEARFRRIVLAVLAILGALMLRRALGAP